MPRQNIVFAIVAPLVLMAIIAVIVVGIGETLLATHHWAHHLYHVGEWPTEEENRDWREIAALYAVGVALVIATLVLIGGSIASRLAPQPKHH
jgi:hypothetical protein